MARKEDGHGAPTRVRDGNGSIPMEYSFASAFGGARPFCHEYKGCSFHGFLASFGARRFPKGNEGKRVSSGYNRRRRLATRSSGKQQAERTAVRAAPIVCPEESPLPASVYDNYAVRRFAAGGLAHRLRRGESRQLQCPKVPKVRTESPLVSPRAHTLAGA